MRSRDRFTMAATVAALAISVLALGGASRWAVVTVLVVAAIAAASQLGSRRRLDGISPLLVMIGIAFCLTAIQSIPLPDSVVERISETGFELAEDTEGLLEKHGGLPPSGWRPISLDPPMTHLELAKFAAYFLLAWMCIRTCRNERGRERLLSLVAGLSGVVALIGIGHEIVGADSLFGIYDPEFANPLVMAPLLNPNHLACLMALGAITAAGLAIHERRAPPIRAMWIVVVLLDLGVCLATRSRGGVVALAAGTVITAVVLVMQRLRRSSGVRRTDVYRILIPAAITVICTLVLVISLGGGGVQHDLESTRLEELSDPRSKYVAWSSALDLVDEAPVLGIGRGAFESSFTRVYPASSQLVFSHAENEYVQALVDWGIGGVIAFALGGLFVIRVLLRRWRNGSLAAVAIGGMAAVGVQSLVDFGAEMPGIAIPCLLVASTLFYVPLKEGSRSRKRLVSRLGVIGVAVIVGLIAAAPLSRTLAEDHAAARTDVQSARAALARHPLDYVSAMNVASVTRDPAERIELINHALRLHPTHSGLHRVVGGWLAATGRTSQAALEFRLSLEGSADPQLLVPEIVSKLKRPEDAALAMPLSTERWPLIAKALVDAKRDDVALIYLVKLFDTHKPPPPELLKRLLALAEKLDNLAIAERVAKELGKFDASLAVHLDVANMQFRHAKYDDALVTLDRIDTSQITQSEQVDARLLRCDVLNAKTQWVDARGCLSALLPEAAVTLQARRKIHARLAKVEEALGNTERAEFERKLSIEAVPRASTDVTPTPAPQLKPFGP